jgi:hypothetical protein
MELKKNTFTFYAIKIKYLHLHPQKAIDMATEKRTDVPEEVLCQHLTGLILHRMKSRNTDMKKEGVKMMLNQIIDHARHIQKLHSKDSALKTGKDTLKEIGMTEEQIQQILPAVINFNTPYDILT